MAWGMGHGAWGMEHGAWSVGRGAWGMEEYSVKFSFLNSVKHCVTSCFLVFRIQILKPQVFDIQLQAHLSVPFVFFHLECYFKSFSC